MLGEFVVEHEPRVADLKLGMPDLVAHRKPRNLLRSERLLVKVDRSCAVVDGEDQIEVSVPLGNWLGHCLAPMSLAPSDAAPILPLPESLQTRPPCAGGASPTTLRPPHGSPGRPSHHPPNGRRA